MLADPLYPDDWIIGACRVCGWKALLRAGLCPSCRDIQIDSEIARRFCALVHRDAVGRSADVCTRGAEVLA